MENCAKWGVTDDAPGACMSSVSAGERAARRQPVHTIIGTRISLVFGLAVLLVVTIGVVSYRSTTRFVESTGRVARTHEVEAQLEEVLSQLKDIEDGARGYVITGDEEYLEPYRAARAVVDASIRELRQLVADDASQQQRLDALEPFVAQEMATSQQAIEARANAGLEAGVHAIRTLSGQQIMDSIRTVIADMKAEEWSLLQQREGSEHEGANTIMRSFAVLTFLAVVLLATVAYLVERDAAARQRAQHALQAAYERLDRRVEERTAELAHSNALLRQEIAEHKRAEEARRESELRFTEFMQHLPGVAFMKDGGGRYVWVNPTFERVFHGTLEQYVGKTDHEIWPTVIADQFQQNDEIVIHSRQTLQVTETVPHDDGVHEWLATKFPILDTEGTARMVAGVAIDITERKRTEKQLRELEKLAQQRERLADIGAITAQIVHDLGNPLAGLSMQAQLVLHRARRDERQPVSVVVQPLERILSEVRRLDGRIKEFMEFSREQRLDLKPLDLGRFLQEVVDIWQPVAAERGITLRMDAPGNGLALTADDEKLRRVFDNLVKNAIEAIDRGPGHIGIHVSAPVPEAVRIAISDTGPGIPENVQAFRLFETTKANGSGLGLAVVKQIVLAHRGTIEFSRVAPHGTVFRIELPRTGPA